MAAVAAWDEARRNLTSLTRENFRPTATESPQTNDSEPAADETVG
jgi:hypothetical protein